MIKTETESGFSEPRSIQLYSLLRTWNSRFFFHAVLLPGSKPKTKEEEKQKKAEEFPASRILRVAGENFCFWPFIFFYSLSQALRI